MLPSHRRDEAGLNQGLNVFVQRATRAQPEHRTELVQRWRVLELPGALTQDIENLLLASGESHGLAVSCSFSHCMLAL
jgi:hypothetical protein